MGQLLLLLTSKQVPRDGRFQKMLQTCTVKMRHHISQWCWYQWCYLEMPLHQAVGTQQCKQSFEKYRAHVAAEQEYFQSLVVCERATFRLSPLQYKPDDCLLIVTASEWSKQSNETIICKMACGEDIPSFFKNRKVEISLDEPLYLLARTWQWSWVESWDAHHALL
jgi:hypothetical protein